MLDPFVIFAFALQHFGGARGEFLRQRGLTCQSRVALCPQRRDASEGQLSRVVCGEVIRFPPSRQPSPP